MLYDQLLPANSTFRPKFKHGVPPVDMLGMCNWHNGFMQFLTSVLWCCSVYWSDIRQRGSKVPHQIPREFNIVIMLIM